MSKRTSSRALSIPRALRFLSIPAPRLRRAGRCCRCPGRRLLDGFQFPFEGRNFIWRGPGSRCTSGFERDQSLKGIFPAESGSPPAGIPTPPAKSEAPGTASAPAQPRAAWTPTPPCTRPHSPWSARIKSWHSYPLLFLWTAPGAHHRRVKRCQPGRKDAKNG